MLLFILLWMLNRHGDGTLDMHMEGSILRDHSMASEVTWSCKGPAWEVCSDAFSLRGFRLLLGLFLRSTFSCEVGCVKSHKRTSQVPGWQGNEATLDGPVLRGTTEWNSDL